MKNIFIISFLSLFVASCSTAQKVSQFDIEKPIVNIECSNSSIKKIVVPLTDGKEIFSSRKYCYVWQLEKQDRTVVLTKTGISNNTKYISWHPKSRVIVKIGNPKEEQYLSGVDLYKFINEHDFSILSEQIQVKSSFYLEQYEDDIYISLTNKFLFKNTDISYFSENLQVPNNTKINLGDTVKLKLGETTLIKIPSPYIDDNNKFYLLKFTINALD